ncbi:MAG: hypothetical protein J0L60_01940 [Ignavibacteria bacterium]|nr:hypothetical protein [Ignavibacteria bacterium]
MAVKNFMAVCLFFFSLLFAVSAQNTPVKEIWKELSKNKFAVVYYDLSSLALAKSDVFDQPVKTEYNSEQSIPGVAGKYFTEVIIYTVSLKEAKYFIKKASYFDSKKKEIIVFDYQKDGSVDTRQMLPVTKGSPVYEIVQLHKLLHSKNEN